METPALPTFSFDAYPQTAEPLPLKPPTDALAQLVVYRREERFATCRQHIELHRRAFYKISLFGEGGGTFTLNDEVISVAPQSILLVRPGTALSWRLHEGRQTGLYGFFSPDFYNAGLLPGFQLQAVLAGGAPYVYHACTPTEYAALWESGEQLYAQQAHPEKARLYLRLLLADVRPWEQAAPRGAAGAGHTVVQQFLHLAEARLAAGEPALPLDAYAEALHLAPKYLSALCRQATGKSAAHLLREKVATEAKVLLTGTALPIGEIAYRLAFYDVAHFSRWFKQAAGQAPSAYRAQFGAYK
ncbi:helix-turn-helix domain-containing protein [Hymenobacter sp. HMF4947]|uniref:Helix-turn-helix domain-containing protein n=1 Tax=Hymenobacter ginkgonis TaxID=2682976 RepID=A0A7K1TIH3_9BACT|nr:helix-turn-helix transcriptional regulator [Hymenobacter ginkgonis]MVN78126.1 helix-turn-helix domain-containing protein [Hymenobacter ginkgonis]